jgi:hypothetical protein
LLNFRARESPPFLPMSARYFETADFVMLQLRVLSRQAQELFSTPVEQDRSSPHDQRQSEKDASSYVSYVPPES